MVDIELLGARLDGDWVELETSVEERTDGNIVLTATTDGFSPFAVATKSRSDESQVTTEPAPTDSTSDESDADDSTAEPEPQESTATAAPEGASNVTDAPVDEPSGFGLDRIAVLVALLAAVAAVAIGRRMRQ